MNYSNRNKMIKELAAEAAEDAKLECAYYGKPVTPEALKVAVSLAFTMNQISFENSTAEFMLETVVLKEIARSFPAIYAEAWPAVGMDQNGNYTTDSSKWA